MADVITRTDLENLKRDADDIGLIANANDTTVVTTRLGRQVKSAAKAIKDLESTAIADLTEYVDKAQAWAEKPENDPVTTGKYSALHWAAKSEEQAELAAESATAASTAKDAAETAKDAAETAQEAAESAQDESESARDKAQAWAENPEDDPVEEGQFSALHHATKAAYQAGLAEAHREAAETYAQLAAIAGNYIGTYPTTPAANKGEVVNYTINGFKHYFQSLIDNNTNTPALVSNYWFCLTNAGTIQGKIPGTTIGSVVVQGDKYINNYKIDLNAFTEEAIFITSESSGVVGIESVQVPLGFQCQVVFEGMIQSVSTAKYEKIYIGIMFGVTSDGVHYCDSIMKSNKYIPFQIYTNMGRRFKLVFNLTGFRYVRGVFRTIQTTTTYIQVLWSKTTSITGFTEMTPANTKSLMNVNESFDSHILPSSDNSINLGSASLRFRTVYAGTGTINTSDAREKTEIAPLLANELAASIALAKEIGSYKFLASIEAKGEGARTHIGLTVQRAIEIMQDHGLDPFKYGFICYDEWEDKSTEHPAEYEEITIPAVFDDEGNEIEPARTEQGELIKEAWTEQTQKAGSRYGFRTDQLLLFLARGFDERLRRLEGE